MEDLEYLLLNSKSAKDSALKCFAFFLISQPLVYLIQDVINKSKLFITYYNKTHRNIQTITQHNYTYNKPAFNFINALRAICSFKIAELLGKNDYKTEITEKALKNHKTADQMKEEITQLLNEESVNTK